MLLRMYLISTCFRSSLFGQLSTTLSFYGPGLFAYIVRLTHTKKCFYKWIFNIVSVKYESDIVCRTVNHRTQEKYSQQ